MLLLTKVVRMSTLSALFVLEAALCLLLGGLFIFWAHSSLPALMGNFKSDRLYRKMIFSRPGFQEIRSLFSINERGIDILTSSGVQVRNYYPGDIVIQQGSEGDDLYIILEGSVRVYATDDDNYKVMEKVFGPGNFFGEMALLTGTPRSATVEVLKSAKLMRLDRRMFYRAIQDDPIIALSILREMSFRIRQDNDHSKRLAERKVILNLLALGLDKGVLENNREIHIELAVVRKTLPEMAETSGEAVRQVLEYLRGKGYIKLGQDLLIVPDFTSLFPLLDVS